MKKLTLIVLLATVGGLGWRAFTHDAPDPKLIYDHFWVDHVPRDKHEKFLAMWLMSEHPVGRFVTRTQWTGQWEEFHYHLLPKTDASMDLLFGNNNERERITWSARPCHENGFDFCLDIAGTSRGTKRYYSKKAWGGQHVNLDAIAASLSAE
ncbi:MAG TPA: hypothetical protein VIA18_31175 [Polyangia bacterium]|jgi:hypothetical protein|nr:hypothetical protein [Polyangia bacterium]